MTSREEDNSSIASRWGSRASLFVTETLEDLSTISSTNDSLSVIVGTLCSLPLSQSHIPLICALLDKTNPYLQEAAIKLAARALKTIRHAAMEFEYPICRLLDKPTVDEWVLEALLEYENLVRQKSERYLCFYVGLAKTVFNGDISNIDGMDNITFQNKIFRNKGIFPKTEIRLLLESMILSSESARTRAILPFFENEYGVSGHAAVVEKIRQKISHS